MPRGYAFTSCMLSMSVCLVSTESTALLIPLTLQLTYYFTWIHMGCFENLWVSKQNKVGLQQAPLVLYVGIICFFLNLKQSELP